MRVRNAFLSVLKRLEILATDFKQDVALSSARFDLSVLAASGALLCNEKTALEKLAAELHLEIVPLGDKEFLAGCEISEISGMIPEDFCLENQVLPLKKTAAGYLVVFANPMNFEAKQSLEFILRERVMICLAHASQIESLLKRHYYFATPVNDHVAKALSGNSLEIIGKIDAEHNIALEGFNSAPVINLVNKVLSDAIVEGASDIHFEPAEAGLEVRFRIDGVMEHAVEFPKNLMAPMLSRLKLLAGMDIAERRKPQNGRMRLRFEGDSIDVRASSIPAAFGEKIVLRLLHSGMKGKTFEDLHMSPEMSKKLRNELDRRGRIVLVTGPTGSGKTTTLYTAIDYLNDGRTNIQTVEDPIEYRVAGISQVQVNEAVNVNFPSALRSFLRQDPDVIMVGEIRDSETAEITMRAAQTGHLVLSTLHTNSAPEAISRLKDLGVPSFVLAAGLSTIIAQRLVREICSECAINATEASLRQWSELAKIYNLDPERLLEGKGCTSCGGSGFKGRRAIYSYFEITPTITEMIQEEEPISVIVKEAKRNGYLTLEEVAIAEVVAGRTTLEEVTPYLEKRPEETVRETIELDVDASTINQVVIPSSKKAVAKQFLEKPLVLLIDDDENIRELYTALLEGNFYEVVSAVDGYDGLEKLYNRVPDLVIVDYMMPKMDGKAFVRQIKSDQRTKQIPVLMFTAAASEEREVDLLSMGVSDFVQKTAPTQVLLARIKTAMGKSAA